MPPRKSRFHSVRGRLFLLIAVLVLPALGIIFALSWEAYRGQRATFRAELTNTARAVAGLVDAEVDRSLAMLETFGASPSLSERNWDRLDSMARRVLPDTRRWLVVVDLQGRQQINTRLPHGATIPDIKLDPDYLAALRAGQVYVSNVVFGPEVGRPVVHIGLPFTPASGELYGLSIVTEPETLGDALDVRRFAPDGVLSIADRAGRIIVRNPFQKDHIGRSLTSDLAQALRERAEGSLESVTLEGLPVLAAFTHAKCGWGVAIGVRQTKVVAASRRILVIGLGSSLLVTLAGVALALWIARAVVDSVDGLAQDAKRLARGEDPAPRNDDLQEITLVAEAMQRLAQTRGEAEAELRVARDRLHEYAQELEKRVEERTASLRAAVAQMEEFSYTVSHDLRAPLRTMSGYANALLEDHAPSLNEEARHHLQRIVRASQRLNRMTTDLLNYSRVARADVPQQRVSLEPIVRAAIEQHAELHPAVADVTIATPLDDVLAHEPSLTQALTNLLTNAAKFVKPGGRPQIRVWTERRDDRVRVWIEDNGIGIPPLHQARLFRIFERSPTAQSYEGTGVGLAIVRKIVEKVGGTCGVESDGANGSRFWIELAAATNP